jgi:hypothetical protein
MRSVPVPADCDPFHPAIGASFARSARRSAWRAEGAPITPQRGVSPSGGSLVRGLCTFPVMSPARVLVNPWPGH